MREKITIGVLDNDIWSARSIAEWISHSEQRFQIVWSCTSTAEAIHRCLFESSRHCPQVLVLDMALDGISGIDVCRIIRQRTADIGIIGISAYDSHRYQDDLAAAGAQAFLTKHQIAQRLPVVISIVAHGETPDPETFMSAHQAHLRFHTTDKPYGNVTSTLSSRELQVLRMYEHGRTTEEIAQHLHISANSVFTYVHRAAAKLGTNNRAQTIRKAKQYNLI